MVLVAYFQRFIRCQWPLEHDVEEVICVRFSFVG